VGVDASGIFANRLALEQRQFLASFIHRAHVFTEFSIEQRKDADVL
jgi:hypothetical protein